jgi:hypothetical protein
MRMVIWWHGKFYWVTIKSIYRFGWQSTPGWAAWNRGGNAHE